jgi:tRNA pseudouridine55 synthase
MNGILNILKPPGMTSHDVVVYVRNKMNIKKVGHTGTLDPGATGVLPLCIGNATKISQFLAKSYKSYRAELTLGISTDTHDNYGKVIYKNIVDVSEDQLIKTFKGFIGKIKQLPPMASAKKFKGKPLYKFAREGKTVPRKEVEVFIKEMKIRQIIYPNKVIFDVICSSGTYIRTLCNDIGNKLGCGGHMSFLIRTRVGNFSINDSLLLEEFEEMIGKGQLEEKLYSIDFPLKHLPRVIVPDKMINRVKNGNYINDFYFHEKFIEPKKELIRIYDSEDNFLALGRLENLNNKNILKPTRVLF